MLVVLSVDVIMAGVVGRGRMPLQTDGSHGWRVVPWPVVVLMGMPIVILVDVCYLHRRGGLSSASKGGGSCPARPLSIVSL
ncbi:hypothetical protein LCGC14_2305510 [marine sediment metagenome]|uniref:Uncharacterized protein n=1 Tax=marine sediment metagenome TaxID=412755 RepID=A0A0F9FH51_9ZZZZ